MDKKDKENKIINNDFTHATIEKLEQEIQHYFEKIEISSDMPAEFKEPLQMWLALSLEDLEWKKEQRARMEQQAKEMERMAQLQERAERKQQRNESIKKSTEFHARWIYPTLIGLSFITLFFFYLLPLYHTKIEPQMASAIGLQRISLWINWLPKDTATQLTFFSSLIVYLCFLAFMAFYIARKIAKKRAKREFGNI